jgi:hypothetical protein
MAGRMTMKQILRSVALRLGWKTSYHVAATYSRDSHIGYSVISLTVDMLPWLHTDNYKELIDHMNSQADRPVGLPTITSITRLGV